MSDNRGSVNGFVGELTFAKRNDKPFLRDKYVRGRAGPRTCHQESTHRGAIDFEALCGTPATNVKTPRSQMEERLGD